MKIIFLGPPGAGKGTVAQSIIAKFGLSQISTGDIFRAAVKNGTELGKKVKAVIDSGGLVPDELTIELVKERLLEEDAKRGFILDGFPRTIAQAEALGRFEKIDMVIDFEVLDNEVLVKRLGGRLTCRKCNAVFSSFHNPPKKQGVCDNCGGELYVRKDDELSSVKNRLDVYERQTAPLKAYYENLGMLRKVDATKQEDAVLKQVIETIEKI